MADDNELLDRLLQLNESQIEDLIWRLKVNRAHLSGGGASLNQRAIDLIRYLEPQVDGLQRLRVSLEKLLPPYDLDDPASLAACPYQGLKAFQENVAEFFFGREAFVDDLVRAVETKPLVAVVGASGSGKSSLVFAGLLPCLRPSGDWLIESLRPEKQPFFRLAVALMRQLEPEMSPVDRLAKANDFADTIQKYGIASVVSEILQERSGKRLLLVVDQFEELYTQCEAGERDRFIDVLLEGIQKAVGLKLVLTLRADFCGQAYAYRPLADALQGADLKLGPMDPKELQEAIERPADLMGVEFETGLTELLLGDVGKEPGNLPLLEFALTELWRMQRKKMLICEAYVRVGGVGRALANHADAVYAKLSPADQQRAQRIFVQLVRPGDGTEDTRRVATRAEVGADNWDLVTQLAGESARLVVTGRNEDTVELVHEALLRAWRRLWDWMKQDRTFRVWQEGLRFARRQWLQSGQDDDALLDGFLLSEAEEWQVKRQEDLSAEEQAFIQLSLEVRDRRIQQREDELQELVEQKDKALQAEAEAAEHARNALQAETEAVEQARKATKAERVKTRFAVATTGLAIVAIIVGGFAGLKQMELQKATKDFLLGSSLPASDLLDKLPDLFSQATDFKKAGDVDLELAVYRRILDYTGRLQAPALSSHKPLNSQEIETISKQAERQLTNTILKNRFYELEGYLNKEDFGRLKGSFRFADFEKKFEPGALQATYKILMREFGAKADLNDNGLIDNEKEAGRVPCELLREIENRWRRSTSQRCGWFGVGFEITATSCVQLKGETLTAVIFNDSYEFPIARLKSCGIAPKA